MIRKQLYLEPAQDQLLKRLAAERGVTEADVVRRALDRGADSRRGGALPPSEQAWQRALRFMESLLNQGPLPPPEAAGNPEQKVAPPPDRGWKREDLYEERLSRYERRNPR